MNSQQRTEIGFCTIEQRINGYRVTCPILQYKKTVNNHKYAQELAEYYNKVANSM